MEQCVTHKVGKIAYIVRFNVLRLPPFRLNEESQQKTSENWLVVKAALKCAFLSENRIVLVFKNFIFCILGVLLVLG